MKNSHPSNYDVIIVGGGVTGLTLALGLKKQKAKVLLIDEGDSSFKASRGNYGLVWVQGKGVNHHPYASWCLKASSRWKDFSSELFELSKVDISYQNNGGLFFCLSEEELEQQKKAIDTVKRMHPQADARMISPSELKTRYPYLGDDVLGASYTSLDGHLNPLFLLKALRKSYQKMQGDFCGNCHVNQIKAKGESFELETSLGSFACQKVVLAAGIGNTSLCKDLNLDCPIKAVKGQIIVTEKLPPFLDLPSLHVKQTEDGSVMLGYSVEDVGINDQTTSYFLHKISERATKIFPFLKKVQAVRSWGSIRIMIEDGLPVYDNSPLYKNAYIITGHSAISLCSLYPTELARGILKGKLPDEVKTFSLERFHA